MKLKKITVMMLAAALSLSAVACGKDSGTTTGKATEAVTTEAATEKKTEAPKEIPAPKDIEAAIEKALGAGYLSTVEVPKDEMFTSAIGSVDLDKLESYVAKITSVPSVDMDQIAIVKCKDAAYADEVVKAINESYAQTISYIRQYPMGVAKVEGARLYKYGSTVIFIIGGANAGDNATEEDAAKLAKAEYEKIDAAIESVCGSLPQNLAVIPADN